MNSENDNQEKELFNEALEYSTKERSDFLNGACDGDEALRIRVEELLRAYEGADDILASETLEHPLNQALHVERPAIDRYKIVEKLGEGGFGVVYRAEQKEPVVRQVALKVIKLGMDTKQVIARFEAERQALAMMEHPNIAKVFDAGTTETGRPYFVMELVRGIAITEYCDEEKLEPTKRLRLFLDVCAAVQHAHQKGIIHRDLKPSNILVTLHDGKPIPKVIDFGIAKATEQKLTQKTFFTRFAQFMGTPAYMSPEQAEISGVDIDTRSDIYSLGVLLYELLTGKTPLDGRELMESDFDEIRRRIREVETVRPSTRIHTLEDRERNTIASARRTEPSKLGSLFRGELDWIVLKALEKNRTRRYETANAFRLDIERFLKNEPVSAVAPSTTYQLKKFIRRNKGLFATGATIAAVLLLASVVSLWQLVLANQASSTLALNYAIQSNRRGEWKSALDYLESAKRHGDPTEITRQRAKALLYLGHLEEAEKAIEELILVKTNLQFQGEAHRLMADLHLEKGSELKLVSEVLETAKASGLSPADNEYVQGLLAGSSVEALRHLERAVELDATHYAASIHALSTRALLGKFKEVEPLANLLQGMYPDDDAHVVTRVLALTFEGRKDEALSVVEDNRKRFGDKRCEILRKAVISWLGFREAYRFENFLPGQTSPPSYGLMMVQISGFVSGLNELSSPGRLRGVSRPVPAISRAFKKVQEALTSMLFMDYKNAAKHFGDAAKIHPDGFFYALQAELEKKSAEGNQQEKLERYLEIESKVLETFSLIPSINRMARINLLSTTLQLAKEYDSSAGPYLKRCLEVLRDYAKLPNLFPPEYLSLASTAMEMGAYGLSLEMLSRWERDYPLDANVRRHRITLASSAKDYALALRELKTLRESNLDDQRLVAQEKSLREKLAAQSANFLDSPPR